MSVRIALTSTGRSPRGSRRANASSCAVSALARKVASRICSTSASKGCPGVRLSSISSRLPPITVRRLLKSCAMPPASLPIASIFWLCRSSPSVRFSSVMFWTTISKADAPSRSPIVRPLSRTVIGTPSARSQSISQFSILPDSTAAAISSSRTRFDG